MNDSPLSERLLADILQEESQPGLRKALLDHTLNAVRRRRRFRQARRTASALAALATLLFVVWRFIPSPRNPPALSHPYILVRTQPLPTNALVQTTPFAPAIMVASTGAATIIMTSAAGHNFRELDDDQLLDLAAPASPMLVRRAPHHAELVFADSAEREALLRN